MLISEQKKTFYNQYKYIGEHAAFYSFHTHLHDLFEFICVNRGSCLLNVDGREVLLNSEEAYLLPPWHIHTIDGSDAEDLYILTFSANCSPCSAYLQFRDGETPYRPDPACIREVAAQLINKECSDPFLLFSCINLLLSDYLRHRPQEETKPSARAKENDLIPRALSYMKAHFNENLTLSVLAKNIGSNASYLSRLLNENNGLGFSGYLNAFRFSQAEVLLRTTDKPVREIAAECGFGSVRTFNRVFLQRYKKTPVQLRKQEQDSK